VLCMPQQTKVSRQMKFSELGLAEPILRATTAQGYSNPTPIQAKAIPIVLAGRDLVGCAQTGTGKTAAFTLPLLDRLMRGMASNKDASVATKHIRSKASRRAAKQCRPVRALILSPTRELAVQIGDSIGRYGRFTPLRKTVVYGGVSQHQQFKALREGVDIIVATPGRLLDLMKQGHINLSCVGVLVLDEADQMLDMGFLPALKRIIAAVPTQRQTLMFSATMPEQIRRLAQQWLRNPAAIEVARVATPAERIAQSVHLVDKHRKADLLIRLLKESSRGRTLVFARTKRGADAVVKHLDRAGLHAKAIHGNKSQSVRSRTLAQFKSKNPPVLVATDIAARGLDVRDISHVVNYDLPEVPETYVHRIGRTARAGADGIAVSFCAGHERELLQQIERLIRNTLTIEPPIEDFLPSDPLPPRRQMDRPSNPRRHSANRPRNRRRRRPAAL